MLWRTYLGDGTWGGCVAQPGESVGGESILLTGAASVPRRVRFTVNEALRFNQTRDRPEASPRTQQLLESLYALRGQRPQV